MCPKYGDTGSSEQSCSIPSCAHGGNDSTNILLVLFVSDMSMCLLSVMQTASTTIDAINSQQIDPLLLHFPLERTSNSIAQISYPTARHIVFRYRCSCCCRSGINRSVSSFTLDRPDIVLHWWPNSVHSSLSYFTP